MPTNDALLLERWVQKRDAEAFKLLVDRYSSQVYSTALRILRTRDQAEDVTQDCFLKLAQMGNNQLLSLPAWLHRVTTNRAISILRSESRRRRYEAEGLTPEKPIKEAEWVEIEEWVDEAIEALPDKQRVPLVEHFFYGRTQKSIAEDLGISRESVGYRLKNGIESIRGFLRQRGVKTTASVLLAGFTALKASASVIVPTALTATLSKIALSGVTTPMTSSGGSQGMASMKSSTASGMGGSMKTMVATVVSLVLIGGGYLLFNSLNASSNTEDSNVEPTKVASKTQEPEKVPEKIPEAVSEKVEEKTPEAPPPQEPKTISIIGKVVGSDTLPEDGVEVMLRRFPPGFKNGPVLDQDYFRGDLFSPERLITVLTDEEGRFEFKIIPPEEYFPEPEESTEKSTKESGAYYNAKQGEQVILIASSEVSVSSPKYIDLENEEARTQVELRLSSAHTVEGRVISSEGKPVSDAVVSAHHVYNKEGYAGSSSLATTDEKGRFVMSIEPKATTATFRVDSKSHGQEFFAKVSLESESLEFKFRRRGTLSGEITWTSEEPAKGMVVVASATVPEPEVLMTYSGWRVQQKFLAEVKSDGSYLIESLQPGFTYRVYVIDPSLGKRKSFLHPLSHVYKNSFKIEEGTDATWNHSIAKLIKLTGKVVTSDKGTPVARANISVSKDGKKLNDLFGECDQDGNYSVMINTGPGKYRVTATPSRYYNNVADLISERFGRDITFSDGEHVEAELQVFEPIVLPFKLLDANRKPVDSIRFKISAELPNGKRFGYSSSDKAEGGNKEFMFHFPIKTFQIELTPFKGGPGVKLEEMTAEIGQVFPVREVVFPPAADVSGVALDSEGNVKKQVPIMIEGKYEDGESVRVYLRTDDEGRFSKPSQFKMGSLTLTITDRKSKEKWTSQLLSTAVGQVLNVGEVRLK